MPVDLVTESHGTRPRPHDARERVSSGRTRLPMVPWRFPLVAIMAAAALALISTQSAPHLSSTQTVSLAGHSLLVQAVAFAPDGRTLASCANDRTVRLWDMAQWGEGRPAPPDILTHAAPVVAMAYAPDGRSLVTSAIGSLVIWSLDPASPGTTERTGETFRGLAFSPDGRTMALGAEDGTIRLWEMPAARERVALRDSNEPVNCVAFSPDGTLLASGSQDGRLVIRDAADGTPVRVLREGHLKPIRALAFSPDGRTLGAADPTGAADAVLYDVSTGAVRTRLPGQPQGIVALAIAPDGRIAATAGIDRSIRIWDLADSTERVTYRDGRVLKSLAFSPDGRWVAYASGEDVTLLDMNRVLADGPISPVTLGIDPKSGDLEHRAATAGRA